MSNLVTSQRGLSELRKAEKRRHKEQSMDSTCRGAPQINSHRDKRHNRVIKGWGDERAGDYWFVGVKHLG